MTDSVVEVQATRRFESLMAVEGRWTGDDRHILVDALRWDGLLPIPLTVDHYASPGQIVGRIETIERRPGSTPEERFIVGTGVLDLASEHGPETARQIEEGFLRGVSIDIDDLEQGAVDPETIEREEDLWGFVLESARIRALALCTIPAFAEAYITLGSVEGTDVPPVDGPVAVPADQVPEDISMPVPGVVIVASGHTITIPDLPPASWFDEPTDVTIEGALTITDEGRVYGLLAPAGLPHRNRVYRGATVPMGNVDYSRFLGAETIVEGGERIVTGNVTFNCGHGTPGQGAAVAVQHYDNSCSLAARIRIGERTDEPAGVWVAGALMPGISGEDVARMMQCRLSGHWEPTANGYEMVAALLVPVPGFAMARSRPSVTVRDGALVASAIPVQFAEHEEPDIDLSDVLRRVDELERAVQMLPVLERRLRVLAPHMRAELARQARGA